MMDVAAEPTRLLILDDDRVFQRCLQRAMERRNYVVTACDSIQAAKEALDDRFYRFAVTDLRLTDGTGIDFLEYAGMTAPQMRVIILTGYGDLATAVTATKYGAVDYLAKPATADEIESSLHGRARPLRPDETFPRPEVQEFRYLLSMYERHGRNMSETARAASMHRRTLQRILRRHGVRPSVQIPAEERLTRAHIRRLARLWTGLLEGDGYGTAVPLAPMTDKLGRIEDRIIAK